MKAIKGFFAVMALLVAALMFTAASAYAMTGSITGGGPITGTSTAISLTDSVTGKSINCASSIGGSMPNTSTPTNPIASITTITFTGCSGGGYGFTSCTVTLPWQINVVGTTSSGVTPVRVTLKLECRTTPSTTCDLTISGSASGSYSNITGRLTLNPNVGGGDALTATVSSGCLGLAGNGDPFTATWTWVIRNGSGGIPQLNITSYP